MKSNFKYNFASLLKKFLEKNKFMSLVLIFGQLKLLQINIKRFGIKNDELTKIEDKCFN